MLPSLGTATAGGGAKMTNSKAKGSRGELALAKFLEDHGHPARRGQQYSGSPDSPDVVCGSLPVHWECKRTERLRLYPSMDQAIEDAGEDEIPVVAHRKNRREWLAILKLEDFLKLFAEEK